MKTKCVRCQRFASVEMGVKEGKDKDDNVRGKFPVCIKCFSHYYYNHQDVEDLITEAEHTG